MENLEAASLPGHPAVLRAASNSAPCPITELLRMLHQRPPNGIRTFTIAAAIDRRRTPTSAVKRSSYSIHLTPMDWQPEALAALKKDVPFFVRPAVRKRVESMADSDGRSDIDLDFYKSAKQAMAPS